MDDLSEGRRGEDDFEYLCVNGHDLCHGGTSAGPECPTCERVPIDPAQFDDEEDDEHDPADECGLTDNVYCTLAGTEHCDFECPFRSELFAYSGADHG